MSWKFQRTYHDVIMGFGKPVPKNAYKIRRPSKFVHRWAKLTRDDDPPNYEPFSWNHGKHHCRLCEAVNAPIHRRIHYGFR